MLREHNCKQVPGEPPRRWISDDYFDLIVWGEPDGNLVGFQLCYDKPYREHALTWKRQGGFSHSGVNAGESGPFSNCTPILVAGGPFLAEKVTRQFLWRSAEIDPQIRDLVLKKIDEYASCCKA
jgi:hypothetical protein